MKPVITWSESVNDYYHYKLLKGTDQMGRASSVRVWGDDPNTLAEARKLIEEYLLRMLVEDLEDTVKTAQGDLCAVALSLEYRINPDALQGAAQVLRKATADWASARAELDGMIAPRLAEAENHCRGCGVDRVDRKCVNRYCTWDACIAANRAEIGECK